MAVGMFNPGSVNFGSGITNKPYLPLKPIQLPQAGGQPQRPTAPVQRPPQQPAFNPNQPAGVVGAQTVRATEGGPFDQPYRQNLATFAGGQFERPGGNLSFDPTATAGTPNSLFGDLGGKGPTDLLSQALLGGGMSFPNPMPPTAPQSLGKRTPQRNPLQWWGEQFNRGGRMMQG